MARIKNAVKKKPLNKNEIKAALAETMCPARAPQTTAQRIVSEWSKWKMTDDWIKQNPDEGGKIATWDDEGNKKTTLALHHEKFDDLNAEFGNLFLIGILRDDPKFFRDIAAAISEKRRAWAKLKDGVKPFPWKKFLLLKAAHEGKENVHQLAKYLKESGIAQKSESLEGITADLFRRRKKLNLPKISSKG